MPEFLVSRTETCPLFRHQTVNGVVLAEARLSRVMLVGVGVLEGDSFGRCGRRGGDGGLYISPTFVVPGKVYFNGAVG